MLITNILQLAHSETTHKIDLRKIDTSIINDNIVYETITNNFHLKTLMITQNHLTSVLGQNIVQAVLINTNIKELIIENVSEQYPGKKKIAIDSIFDQDMLRNTITTTRMNS